MTRLVCTLLALATLAAPAWGLDSVRTTKGTTINGTLQEMTPREVVLKGNNGGENRIPVGEIESIKFQGEPPQLNVARSAALAGRLEEAQRQLEKVAQDGKGLDRAEVQQDLHYWQAFCAARLALAGSGDVLAAGKQMRDFLQKYPNNYHLLTANEILGDLLAAIEKYDLAQQHYAAVEKLATSNDVKMRARVAQGSALVSEAKWSEALAAFEGALTLAAAESNPQIDRQKNLANLGKAVCLAALGKPDEGIQIAEGIIAAGDPEQADLFARAYNALGTCLRKAGRSKDALLAFLHVDVLYSSEPTAHAEALKNLTQLWAEIGNPQRAAEAQEVLQTRYANSRWAKS
jgi:hypothetical protein